MNIGFIGLGNMGSGMAGNLLSYCQENGYELYVTDINRTVVTEFEKRGAIACNSAQNVARQCEVVFTSLPSAKEINLLAPEILQNLPRGAVWFETSTNELVRWEQVKALAPSYITLVDAPVTGGAEGAAAGTLTMLLGIDEDTLINHKDILASFTNRAVRMGPSGAGYVAKLCQLHLNYLAAQGIGEAMMLGAKADLDLDVLYDVLGSSCAQSYVVDNYIPKVLDGSYDPSFSLGLAHKDMQLISNLGTHLSVPLPLGDKVCSSYKKAEAIYGSNVPHLKIVNLLEDETGRLLRGKKTD